MRKCLSKERNPLVRRSGLGTNLTCGTELKLLLMSNPRPAVCQRRFLPELQQTLALGSARPEQAGNGTEVGHLEGPGVLPCQRGTSLPLGLNRANAELRAPCHAPSVPRYPGFLPSPQRVTLGAGQIITCLSGS